MCGPAGSGKTTIARTLEAEGLVRLSFDDEAWRRGVTAMPLPDDVRREIERGLKRRLVDLVSEGRDVVLDFSFWSRRMRDEYRMLLRPLSVEPVTLYLDTPREIALARVNARSAGHGDDFALPAQIAAAYFDNFEPPSADEGPLEVMRSY
jgi:predicted kinase